MKKQILASVLASVLATSSVYAWGFGGSSKEKPNYDYSGEKELMSLSSFSGNNLRIDDAKYWCLDQGNDLGCIWLDKPEVGSSSLPRDTIDVLLIDTLTALFAVSLSLKFPKSMVQFL